MGAFLFNSLSVCGWGPRYGCPDRHKICAHPSGQAKPLSLGPCTQHPAPSQSIVPSSSLKQIAPAHNTLRRSTRSTTLIESLGRDCRGFRFHSLCLGGYRTRRQMRRWPVGHDMAARWCVVTSPDPLAQSARRGAYAIRALPDLCLGIISRRLGHLDP